MSPLVRRTQTGKILGVERAESSFNGLTETNNPVLNARTEQCYPKLATIQ
jgi:hypothetical protein